jgi:hypothetical protein
VLIESLDSICFIRYIESSKQQESNMRSIKEKFSLRDRRKLTKFIPLLLLALLVSTVSAAVYTMYYATGTATVKTPDVQLIAGSDSFASPISYPNATVTVASTYDYATIAFSLFPSQANTPQPATYYTNLTLIKNTGTISHTIQSITISGLTGGANLGNVTIYYYTSQNNNPSGATAQGSVVLTSSSTGSYTLISSQTLAASTTNYIEIVGYAAPGALAGSTIGFTVSIQWA